MHHCIIASIASLAWNKMNATTDQSLKVIPYTATSLSVLGRFIFMFLLYKNKSTNSLWSPRAECTTWITSCQMRRWPRQPDAQLVHYTKLSKRGRAHFIRRDPVPIRRRSRGATPGWLAQSRAAKLLPWITPFCKMCANQIVAHCAGPMHHAKNTIVDKAMLAE